MAATSRWTTWSDVQAVLRRRWDDGSLLRAHLLGEPVAPRDVPVRAPTARQLGDEFDAARDWSDAWRTARLRRARLETAPVGGRLFGVNELPRRVVVDTERDLWSVLGVAAAVDDADRLLALTRERLPAAAEWVVRHPHQVLRLSDVWPRLLAAAAWVVDHGSKDTYLRQIDAAGVDTKLVETHRGVLAALLDCALPPERIDADHGASSFARRYRLRPKPELVRLRSFHPADGPFTDVTVRLDELAARPLAAESVLVVENEVTFLALPALEGTAVLLSGGYAVGRLAALPWLADRSLVYWGDLDTHGLAQLDSLRARLPHVRSVLMDAATLLDHRDHWGRETTPTTRRLERLTPAEESLYRDLGADVHGDHVRLEQERVPFSYALDQLEQAVFPGARGELSTGSRSDPEATLDAL